MAAYNKCLQITFIIVQFLVLVLGLALVGLGAYVLVVVEENQYSPVLTDDEFTYAPIVLIVAGCCIAAVSLLGVLGACCSKAINRVLLGLYIGIVILIFVLEIAGSILAFFYRDTVHGVVEERLNATLPLYNQNATGVKAAWDEIQSTFSCCGIVGPSDWQGNIPASCCETSNPCTNSSSDIFSKGCEETVVTFFTDQLVIVAAVGITFVVAEVLVVLMAFCLLCCTDFDKD